jgi:EAL domain-containing protein (putative c-di-GMP-specific phosphodiesterase class I)
LEFGDEVCIPHRFINRLLIQKIKIPSDVVEEILDQTTSLVFGKNVKLLKGLVKFLKELEISVLVDGVKTKAAVDFLSLMGVDEAQGPYFGPPLDGEKFLECLKSFHKTGRCASN